MSIDDFTLADARDMFAAMVDWLGQQQVTDPQSEHDGAIYFTIEDRYCNRDTACAAAVFMRQARLTGDPGWSRQAAPARDAVLRMQLPNGGLPEMRGREQSDGGSLVNTGVAADNLLRAYALGLPFGDVDLLALRRMADFTLTLEWQSGAFYHDTNHVKAFDNHKGDRWGDEGSQLDCQNTTALAAMTLLRLADFLERQGGAVRSDWRAAAARAVEHLLAGQLPNGHWPYWIGADWTDIGHHAMVLHHLAEAAAFPPHDRDPRIRHALVQGGRWLVDNGLLQTKLGTKINWRREQSACVYFTHDFFLTAGALGRLGTVDLPGRQEWHHEALELLRYVRTDLWDNPEYEREGPLLLTEAGLRAGYAWFGQSMGWCLYMLDDLIEQLGGWEQ